MAGARTFVACLVLALIAWGSLAEFPSCDGITTTAGDTVMDPDSSEVPVDLNVQGQSGKFTLVPKGSDGNSVGIRVTMDALREVDSAGEQVGKTGKVKHSINTFATQSFTVGSPEPAQLAGGVGAVMVSFESPISSIGMMAVDTYLMTDSGTVGMSNDSWSVGVGDLKWNIRFWDWTWCGDSAATCPKGEVGDAIELDITVQIMGENKVASKGGSNTTVSLGSDAKLELSANVQKDCVWTQMADGYPSVSTSGSSTTITFRFPRFTDGSLYDPVISGVADEFGVSTVSTPAPSTSPTDPASSTSTDDPVSAADRRSVLALMNAFAMACVALAVMRT